jgi:hypothetical protein
MSFDEAIPRCSATLRHSADVRIESARPLCFFHTRSRSRSALPIFAGPPAAVQGINGRIDRDALAGEAGHPATRFATHECPDVFRRHSRSTASDS